MLRASLWLLKARRATERAVRYVWMGRGGEGWQGGARRNGRRGGNYR